MAATPIRIRTVAHGGEGVGVAEAPEADRRTWFVDGALPGELVEVELEHEAKQWLRGRITEIRQSSADRTDAPCPLADRCGGCSWQHVQPQAQGQLKVTLVRDQLRGVLPPDLPVQLTTGQSLGYRRRAKMHYVREPDGLRLGFRRAKQHALVDVPECPVLHPVLDRAMQAVRELRPWLPGQGNVLGITDGQVAVLGLPGVRPDDALEHRAQALIDETLVGLAIRGGRRRLEVGKTELQLDGGGGWPPMIASPFGFAQAQAELNRTLVEYVVAAGRPTGKRVLELFAGSGNFTRVLAREAARVWALDDSRESVKLLRRLAETHRLSINAKHGRSERLLESLRGRGVTYELVVLDPPRRGLGESAARALAEVASDRIVYVSCDPATLARDLRVLHAGGHRVVELAVFDMMPMTPEVEVVATLQRRAGGSP